MVFFSSGNETASSLYLASKASDQESFSCKYSVTKDGDGTVPLISQKANFPTSCLMQISENPTHVPAPTSDFVWRKIIEKLSSS